MVAHVPAPERIDIFSRCTHWMRCSISRPAPLAHKLNKKCQVMCSPKPKPWENILRWRIANMKRSSSVQEYIANAPAKIRPKLREMRSLIKSAAPKADEKISYGMPYY